MHGVTFATLYRIPSAASSRPKDAFSTMACGSAAAVAAAFALHLHGMYDVCLSVQRYRLVTLCPGQRD